MLLRIRPALYGAGLALAGVGILELLMIAGWVPYSPLGWPGLGTIAAAAFFGVHGFFGGATVALSYYAVNLAHQGRFAGFFASVQPSVTWLAALLILGGIAIAFRGRLVRAESAAALEQSLRESVRAAHERLEKALDGSSMALWDADLRAGRVFLSEAWAEIVGSPSGDLVATVDELAAMVHPDDLEATRRAQIDAMKGTRPGYAFEHRVRSASGEWKWILSRGQVTERDPASGRALRMIGTNVDITDRKRVEEALQSVAYTDSLTGLANRVALADRVRQAMARSRRSGNHVALLYIDIDRFKRVNDELGHAAGDKLLGIFAMRLKACVRASDTVARLGGDEFVVLIDDMKERENAVRVAEKILRETRAPVSLEASERAITTSIGIAYCGEDQNEEELLKRADGALYEAKRSGRNAYRIADR